MVRFRYLLILLLYPILTAQVPYEYFEFRSLEPTAGGDPQNPWDRYPLPEHMPSAMGVDSLTGDVGDLDLVEPFSPPVGIYQRRRVYERAGMLGGGIAAIPGPGECVPWMPAPADPKKTFHRSALTYIPIANSHRAELPSDTSEMQILSYIAEIVEPEGPANAALFFCDGNHYEIHTDRAGVFRVEYETASPADLVRPSPPKFFSGMRPMESLLDEELDDAVAQIVHGEPDLVSITTGSDPVPDLMRFFQHFKSTPLEGSRENSLQLMHSIVRERKGQCRHRSLLLMLVLQHLGIHARLVANEAHAFVEIQKNGRWYSTEMGGTANSLNTRSTGESRRTEHRNDVSFLDMDQGSQDGGDSTSPASGNASGAASPRAGNADAQASASAQPGHTKSGTAQSGNPQPGNAQSGTAQSSNAQSGNDAKDHERQDSQEIYAKSADGKIRVRAERSLPERGKRGSEIPLSGWIQDAKGNARRKATCTLRLRSGAREESWTIQTDKRGHFDTVIKLPPDWPVGETKVEWDFGE